MSPQTASRKHGRHHVSISAASTLLALALGCAAASGVAPPTVPWSQTAVTAAAAAFAGQIDALYETAIKDPSFGGVPMHLELRLSVEDSPNSAGVSIDAIRCAKLALDRGIGGALVAPSAYFMKHPPTQLTDD